MHPTNELKNLRRRVNRARENAPFTCSASRHVQTMAEDFLRYGPHCLTQTECSLLAESMLATVEALWKARAELADLRAENEALRELTKTYAAHGALGAMQRALRAEASEARAQTDAARWRKVRDLMAHERSGPIVGWTLGLLLPGDDPDSAIDAHD